MNKNKRQVAILLSTYNGTRYLRELFDSLLSQTHTDFTIYVRDDGSKDDTVSIIKEYCENDERVQFIDDQLHLGPTKTFMHLLQVVDSSYYMFCDQDDVWLPDKVKVSVEKIKEIERQAMKPIIVYTDLVVTDGDLNPVAQSMWEYSHLNVDTPTSFNYICVYNNIPGCSSIINNTAKEVVDFEQELPKNIYHDWWIAICVSKHGGKIVPLKQSTILFRRHGDNETNVSSESRSLSSKIKRLRRSYELIHNRYGFFKTIGYGSFLKYLFYKSIVSLRYGNK